MPCNRGIVMLPWKVILTNTKSFSKIFVQMNYEYVSVLQAKGYLDRDELFLLRVLRMTATAELLRYDRSMHQRVVARQSRPFVTAFLADYTRDTMPSNQLDRFVAGSTNWDSPRCIAMVKMVEKHG